MDAIANLPAEAKGKPVPLARLAGSAKALLVAVLRERGPRPIVVCCVDQDDLFEWQGDLALFSTARSGRREPLVLPELERDENLEPAPKSLLARSLLVQDVGPGDVLLTDMSALLAPIATREDTTIDARLPLRTSTRLDVDALIGLAEDHALRRVPHVLATGEFARRGDVIDIWLETERRPLRIELFDDEIESLRGFDPATQTSTDWLDETELVFTKGVAHGQHDGSTSTNDRASDIAFPLDYMPDDALVIVVEPVRFEEQLSRFTLRAGTLSKPVAAFERALGRLASYSMSTLPAPGAHDCGVELPRIAPLESWDLKGRLLATTKLRDHLLLVLRSEPEVRRTLALARETIGDVPLAAIAGELSRGFRIPDLECTVLGHAEFFGTGTLRRRPTRSKRKEPITSTALTSFFELATGDLVVHAVHGIAKFLGIERVARGTGGGTEDHLRLVFRDDVEVLVPASKIDLVQKYVGAGGALAPRLDKLGGKAFSKRKLQVVKALHDMAADLLDVQLRRQAMRGFACPPEDSLYTEFENAFAYTDTPDQDKASAEILRDLRQERPMDRLLCGDVGFGKTEIAMRAAFCVASAGRQVAMLVPTTLLAEQHGRTFRDRFASFPMRVEVLSRLQKPKESREVLDSLSRGSVDIVIGTHKLLAKSVKFKDLGLLLIDEEQRFGVAHKEKIRQLRAHVDVLTLTATPIPRTLHMSLLGIKDISSLSTPPPGRQEIETQVVHKSSSVIRNAILRELARGGQVFFLHNKVYDIQIVKRELEDLVPEARFVVGHGQMTEKELLAAMRRFVNGEADVLLSTTIVESGIDIPRANTILIDNASDFGLADLHQLRGRVGRDVHKAHCLLLVDPTRPQTPDARNRLQAMSKFSGLGAGFQIAMRDLEIRGTGNLLGPEQSGHIAAIGYDMYCKLLQAAAMRTQSPTEHQETDVELVDAREVDVDLGVEAFLPESFAPDQRMRLALLREMDGATDTESFDRIHASLRDRFGRLPTPARNLLRLFFVKHRLGGMGVTGLRFQPPDQLLVRHASGRGPHGSWLRAFDDVRPISPDKTCLVVDRVTARQAVDELPDAVLAKLTECLRGGGSGLQRAATDAPMPRKKTRGQRRRRDARDGRNPDDS
ncbi:MAG: transcription-repair coupling factor [Planctomycetes bacterium]|nr:transcription-repair coupling factor [Planctomycetota bacterium]